jgi:hypothetical protein
MLRFALAVVRVWTTLYTSGMPRGLRETRLAEIESDLWESQHDRRPESDAGVATQMLLRLFRGVPDDLLWRLELIDLRSRRRRTGLWLTAVASILVAISLWVGPAMTRAELPQPPNLTSLWERHRRHHPAAAATTAIPGNQCRRTASRPAAVS